MILDLSSLNENQLVAVNWQDNPLLVLAGPGSGKTRVLTYRIARIIAETPDQHFIILALTFTNKAAAEMRERLTKLIPNVTERVEVTTFHSFAASLLRQHGSHIGLRPDFTILNQEEDQKAILQEVLSKRDMENYSSEKLLPLINKLLQYGVFVENAKSILLNSKFGEEQAELLTQLYSSYCSQSIQSNCLDFGNLIIQATILLRDKPFIRKLLYRIYYHICVDEFQDTNQGQYNLLKQLVNPERPNLFIVADDDQIMYQWNGASPERLKILQNDYQTTKLIQLPENYRCPFEIIDLANKLISHNPHRYSDKLELQAHRQASDSNPICVQKFATFEEEAKWIANDIARRSDKAGCAVLARSKRLLEIIVAELERLSIPAYLHERKNEFESTPLIWLHSVLRLANTRHDKKQLYRVCKAFHQLEGIEIKPETVESLGGDKNEDYLRAWHILTSEYNELSGQVKQILTESIPRLMDRLDFNSFIKKAFDWFDTLKSDEQETFVDYEEEKKTWQELQTEIEGQYGREQVTLHLLLQEIDLCSKKPSPPKDAIPCFTVHVSKGMEFKHVYLAGMVQEQFPSWQAIKKGDNSSEMEEERRNCFVAITRTQETLTLTYSEKIFGWNKKSSRFLKEMDLVFSN